MSVEGLKDMEDTDSRKEQGFRRHKFLDYQGYAFPWYATLIWITFFVCGMIYFVRNVLLR